MMLRRGTEFSILGREKKWRTTKGENQSILYYDKYKEVVKSCSITIADERGFISFKTVFKMQRRFAGQTCVQILGLNVIQLL